MNIQPILDEFGVTERHVLSRSRKPRVVEARQACMVYMLRTGMGTKQVGHYFHKAHSAVCRANIRFNQYSDIYPLQRKIDREIIPQLLRS